MKLHAQVVLGGALEMYPAAITQKEKQLARLVVGIEINLLTFLNQLCEELLLDSMVTSTVTLPIL